MEGLSGDGRAPTLTGVTGGNSPPPPLRPALAVKPEKLALRALVLGPPAVAAVAGESSAGWPQRSDGGRRRDDGGRADAFVAGTALDDASRGVGLSEAGVSPLVATLRGLGTDIQPPGVPCVHIASTSTSDAGSETTLALVRDGGPPTKPLLGGTGVNVAEIALPRCILPCDSFVRMFRR